MISADFSGVLPDVRLKMFEAQSLDERAQGAQMSLCSVVDVLRYVSEMYPLLVFLYFFVPSGTVQENHANGDKALHLRSDNFFSDLRT